MTQCGILGYCLSRPSHRRGTSLFLS